ncbi:hypothetical protein GJ743_18255 [Agromyces bracchium]|uniref:Uncharacterized protein n=1 Tax=Agromyces bracchium TaxID=88376 RepID=A0A6I3MA08_9MICO|nr:hypothetical protein [Agromyces bracchium]MTH70309.1 hypothetical protein [Agromyces bracchium]
MTTAHVRIALAASYIASTTRILRAGRAPDHRTPADGAPTRAAATWFPIVNGAPAAIDAPSLTPGHPAPLVRRALPRRAASPAPAPAVPMIPVLPARIPSADAPPATPATIPPIAARWSDEQAPTAVPVLGAADIPAVVERVVGELDRRVTAARERRGWTA